MIEKEERGRNIESTEAQGQIVLDGIESVENNRLSAGDLWDLFCQISSCVNDYNHNHPSEMLAKTPEVIREQFSAGLSCILARLDRERGWEFVYHGTIYPAFENGEEMVLGFQVVELGTWITNPKYRNQGLGTIGLRERLKKIDDLRRRPEYRSAGIKIVGISTVKRLVTGHVFDKMNCRAISYWEHPYLSFLTDTCQPVSERYGHESCQYRRSSDESTKQNLLTLFQQIGGNAYIPCTLVTIDPDEASSFDQKMRRLHWEWLGESIPPGDISVRSYGKIAAFYEEAARRAGQR